MALSNRKVITVVLVLVAVLVGLLYLAGLYTDLLWFAALGYSQVFWTQVVTRIALALVGGVAFWGFMWWNVRWALETKSRTALLPVSRVWEEIDRRTVEQWMVAGLFWLCIVMGVVAALGASGHWMNYLLFAKGGAFGVVEPLFHRDAGFYIFRLPFLRSVLRWGAWAMGLAFVVCAAIYFVRDRVGVAGKEITADAQSKFHLSLLVAGYLVVRAVGFRFAAWGLLFSQRGREGGVVTGASYVDRYWMWPVLTVLSVAALVVAVMVVVTARRRTVRAPLYGIVGLIALMFLGEAVGPQVVRAVVVRPNELLKEKLFIERNIQFTRQAYGIDQVKEIPFEVSYDLTADDIRNDSPTIENIRLWDHRPLRDTYNQLQVIRQYYRFSDVDLDRYTVRGRMQQVLLAARELRYSVLQSGARSWVNRHIIYTHGYGAAVSPVSEFNREGAPVFLVKDIPPRGIEELPVDRPEIYYGEWKQEEPAQRSLVPTGPPPGGPGQGPGQGPQPQGRRLGGGAPTGSDEDDYVLVKTKQKEFDFPQGDENRYSTYEGRGGVPINNVLKRMAFALRFRSLNILVTGYISPKSRIMIYRAVSERAKQLAPFLEFDADPYLVISEGRLFWILDAYTTTRWYPYSADFYGMWNYMRNSVKIVLDAYNGSVDMYVWDPNDPLIKAYQRIFPVLFKPKSEIPEGLRAHLRYPQGMFLAQAAMFQRYHMKDYDVFYNREDMWAFPKEQLEDQPEPQDMMPYYVVMRLPGAQREEFILMLPFTPASGRDNMIAWMCAKCDPADYGKLILYKFPKQVNVYGPRQIEARIQQEPTISPQLTLWSQRGSQVYRGNLLVIPIKNSLLYVQPLYLQSEQSKIPELKRVFVGYGDQVVMGENLEGALKKVFGGEGPLVPEEVKPPQLAGEGEEAVAQPPPTAEARPAPVPAAGADLLGQIEEHMRRAEQNQQQLQQELGQLKQLLEQMRTQAGR